ncbi:PREDICTED: splicing factor, proline- and glutamine-rich-like [Lipotes vexillifer]|uniref:Splicing factor, proline- and glutamine-rich-like n=1 Tax=Lipotes vexillifer TaxID=118797 RepID=A0A340Y355_LIPVE|nr:PREDICTED: splicing factor, proline- and glutamine-rich-like [Lipotes vexillifer]
MTRPPPPPPPPPHPTPNPQLPPACLLPRAQDVGPPGVVWELRLRVGTGLCHCPRTLRGLATRGPSVQTPEPSAPVNTGCSPALTCSHALVSVFWLCRTRPSGPRPRDAASSSADPGSSGHQPRSPGCRTAVPALSTHPIPRVMAQVKGIANPCVQDGALRCRHVCPGLAHASCGHTPASRTPRKDANMCPAQPCPEQGGASRPQPSARSRHLQGSGAQRPCGSAKDSTGALAQLVSVPVPQPWLVRERPGRSGNEAVKAPAA